MDKPRAIRLLVVDDSSAKLKEVRLPLWKLISVVSIVVILGGVTVYGAGNLLSRIYTRQAMAEVTAENQNLRENIASISTRLARVDTLLSEIASSDYQLRLMADLNPIDPETRMMGIGGMGGATGSGDLLAETGELSEEDSVRRLVFDLDKIEREIELQHSSFLEIKRQLASKEEIVLATPSIRPAESGFYSSGFGYRRDPFTRRRAHHSGLDIVAPVRTPIIATADGTVISAERASGYGKVVVIDHGFGYRTLYAHLSAIDVHKGQTVKRGTRIGALGNTGRSTGAHLHYEVHINKKPVNPMDYIFSNDLGSLARR